MKNPIIRGTFEIELIPGQLEKQDLTNVIEGAKQFGFESLEAWQEAGRKMFGFAFPFAKEEDKS